VNAWLSSELLRIVQIVWLDLLLSGDNAVVIALACRDLADRQRKPAAALGAAAAILLRVAFAAALLSVLRAPFLKLVGAALLLWIAVRLTREGRAAHGRAAPASSLASAVRVIVFADALMSLDNVLAITAAAHGDPWLVLFGLTLSLPLVVFGASLFLRLLGRFPWLLWASAALVGWSAGQMAADDPWAAPLLAARFPQPELCAGALGAALVLAFAAAARAWRRRTSTKARSG
jgi:YjbE family integral membrane protein